MADTFSDDKRSDIMSRVRSRRNKSTELALIKIFKEQGIKGWRRDYEVKGHPDFIFLNIKAAIFVDGCFWHGHDCRNTQPEDNKEYWQQKRERNIKRDIGTTESFNKRGWLVIRIWECELKKANRTSLLKKIEPLINRSVCGKY
jgi:DNA mismatch endonuclease (patch repair protein)